MSRRRRQQAPVALVPDDFERMLPANVPENPTYSGRKPGRPSLLTPENEQRFLLLLRAGNYRYVAAEIAGLSPHTVDKWIQRGLGRDPRRPPRPEYVRFARLVREAEAFAEALVTNNLVELTRTNYSAALAWLRTRHPERWPRPGGERWADEEPDDGVNGYRAPSITIEEHHQHDTRVLVINADDIPDLAHRLIQQQREQREQAAPPPEPDVEVIDHGATSRSARLDPLRSEE